MKIKSFFAVVFAAAVTLTSCSKDDENANVSAQSTKVQLVIEHNTQTRAASPSQTAQTIAFTRGYVYFTKSDGTIVNAIKIVTGAPGEREVNMSEGVKTFEGINAEATNVHIVGNIDGLNGAGNINDIMSKVEENYDAVGKGLANVSLYGGAALNTTNPLSYTAAVSVKPTGSRFEIAQFTAEGALTSYSIEGIYINNFYTKIKATGAMSGAVAPANDLQYNGSEIDGQTPSIYLRGSAAYPAAFSGITFDEYAVPHAAVANVCKPAGTDVWAYNVLAPTSGVFPHIIIRFSGMNTDAGFVAGQKAYITVRDFITPAGDPVTFEGGKIYKISNFVFNESHLDGTTEPTRVQAVVTVSYINWEEVAVKPVH